MNYKDSEEFLWFKDFSMKKASNTGSQSKIVIPFWYIPKDTYGKVLYHEKEIPLGYLAYGQNMVGKLDFASDGFATIES